MARIARLVVPGMPYHITQRGNGKSSVFSDGSDRLKYMTLLQEYSGKHALTILSYCLMDNHVHFIAIPYCYESLARVFGVLHMRYASYFNKKRGTPGHLWQGRFYSCILDESHLVSASRYIERNPVRAGMAESPWAWKWSSALDHIGKRESDLDVMKLFEHLNMNSAQWQHFIEGPDDADFLLSIRKNTLTGQPFVSEHLKRSLEEKTGISLKRAPVGRPKRNKTEN